MKTWKDGRFPDTIIEWDGNLNMIIRDRETRKEIASRTVSSIEQAHKEAALWFEDQIDETFKANMPEAAPYEPSKIVIDGRYQKGQLFISEKKLNLIEYRDLRVRNRFMRYVECTFKLCLWDNGPGRVETCIDSIDVIDEIAACKRAEDWFNDIAADPERTPNHIFVAPEPE